MHSLFPRDVLGEIWDLIGSVSGGFSYLLFYLKTADFLPLSLFGVFVDSQKSYNSELLYISIIAGIVLCADL